MGDFPAINFLREAINSKVRAEFTDALHQWLSGNETPMLERFPGAYYLLVLSDVQTLHEAFDKSIAIHKEAAEKTIDYLAKIQTEATINLDKAQASTRPFDIVARYNDLLKVEYAMIEQGILDRNKRFIPSRVRNNKRCLAGLYKLLIKSGYFKKFGPGKSEKNKRVTNSEIYRFLNHRYGITHFQELKRNGDYEELAIRRFSVLSGYIGKCKYSDCY